MPSKRKPKKKREKCPSLIDKVALEAENRREILISREQGKEKSHPPQRKIRKEAEICIAIPRLHRHTASESTKSAT